MTDLDDRIALASRHVARGRRIVTEQRERVAGGAAGSDAFKLLRTFEQSLEIFETDCAACSRNAIRGDRRAVAAAGFSLRRRRTAMDDAATRAALQRHWDASDVNDFDVEHEIYRDDAVLFYPQSGERIRGRRNIQQSRFVQPNRKRFSVGRIIGGGDLWVSEFVLSYDGVPAYAVSIMEFRDGLVASETQYFAEHFDPAPSRAHLVERTE